MSINVKNREAQALLAELKKRSGRGTTDLPLDLLRRELARVDEEVERRIRDGLAADRKLQAAWARRALIEPRPLDQVIEYDENGLPA